MKAWLRETHGPGFELLRHFLWRFFDSDFVTAPGQVSKMLIAGTPVFFQWFFLLIYPLYRKYASLSALSTGELCGQAIQADELWLITLVMSAIGLLTALKWQGLFPDSRDYRVLGALPLRSGQIFSAKLAALVLVAVAALVILNFLPSVLFPALSGQCAANGSLAGRVLAHAKASLAGCAFFLFGLVALQGVLLNLLPLRAFSSLARNLQGLLVASMLALIVASFSIQPKIANALLQPARARWLPPVWFLGLYQTLSGNHDPEMGVLAHRSRLALAIALSLTLLTYLLSYRRRRISPIEAYAVSASHRRVGSFLLDWLAPDPRQQAVMAFMMKTLTRSSYHRVLVMSYGGLTTAILETGFMTISRAFDPARVVAADFVFYHITTLLFLLVAARHIFSRPLELGANWVFQITEREGRRAWQAGVDRFVLFLGVVVILLLPFPFELRLLGVQGLAECGLFMVVGLLSYDWIFSSWEKLPFTCSHLPGKTPAWMIVACLGLVGIVSILHGFLMAILHTRVLFMVVFSLMLATWIYVHRERLQAQAELRLQYEDVPEPAVRELKLLR